MFVIKTEIIREEREMYFEKHLKLCPSPNISDVIKGEVGGACSTRGNRNRKV